LESDDEILWPKIYTSELHKRPELFIKLHNNQSFNNESVLSMTPAYKSTLPLYLRVCVFCVRLHAHSWWPMFCIPRTAQGQQSHMEFCNYAYKGPDVLLNTFPLAKDIVCLKTRVY
jgi:hypothetical protein